MLYHETAHAVTPNIVAGEALERPGEEILTRDELAELWRVHPRTITNMVRAGKLPALRLGKLYRFRRSQIELLFPDVDRDFAGNHDHEGR